MTAPTPRAVLDLVEQYSTTMWMVVRAEVNGAELSSQRHADASWQLLDQIRDALAAPSGETAPQPVDGFSLTTDSGDTVAMACPLDGCPEYWDLDGNVVTVGQVKAAAERHLSRYHGAPAGGEVAAASVPAAPNAQATPAIPVAAIRAELDALTAARTALDAIEGDPDYNCRVTDLRRAWEDAVFALAEAVHLAAPSGEQPTAEPAGEVDRG